jgi:DNA-binding MarR family transcriptional regulator
MHKQNLSEANFALWLLIGKVNHSVMLGRKIELSKYHVPVRRFYALRTIQALGPKPTISEVAKQMEREEHVVSRQAISLEKDGLIKRVKLSPSSKLLGLELTQKGIDLVKAGKHSKLIDDLFASLSPTTRKQMEAGLNQILKKLEARNSLKN